MLAAGVYLAGRVTDSGSGALQPAAGIASPLVTVLASPLLPAASRTPTPKAAPSPLVTVRPPAPSPVVTVRPATPGPVVTVRPRTPGPVVTVRPPAPTTSPIVPPVEPPPVQPDVPAAEPPSPSDPPPLPDAVLGRGSTGADVRVWQAQMARRGWRIQVDGVFGPESARVARRFQHNKGLLVDGLVGRQTWAAAWRLPVIR